MWLDEAKQQAWFTPDILMCPILGHDADYHELESYHELEGLSVTIHLNHICPTALLISHNSTLHNLGAVRCVMQLGGWLQSNVHNVVYSASYPTLWRAFAIAWAKDVH